MAQIKFKRTPHLTDAQFKASLDECNNYLSEHALSLLAFQRKLQDDLENLEPEDFSAAYTNTLAKELSQLLSNVADIGRTTLDRLTFRVALLTAREELRETKEKKGLL